MPVSEEKFSEYYKNRFQDQLSWYENKAIYYKRIDLLLNIIIYISAVLVPVSIAILPSTYRFIQIGLSVELLICLFISRVYKPEGNWLNYRSTAELLKREAILFQSAAGEYGSSERAYETFIEHVESIISRENTLWLTTLTEKK